MKTLIVVMMALIGTLAMGQATAVKTWDARLRDLIELSVRNRRVGHFFNRLMLCNLDCFWMPRPQSRIGPCRISGKH
jgi:hypothetical protein